MKTTKKATKRTEFIAWENGDAKVVFSAPDREYVALVKGAFFACGDLQSVETKLRNAGHYRAS